jgi:Ca-activated chloride channel family protein
VKRAAGLLFAALLGLLAGCSQPGPQFRIIAGSEQKSLEPLVLGFCKHEHIRCQIDYKGSLDIGLMLDGDAAPEVDAIWPASSLWVEMYDTHRRVKDLKSIDTTPVILGVRMDKARELNWIGKPVRMADILSAVQAHKLSFLMTSATQSNSGAAAYLAMLAAAFGDASRLEPAALQDPRAQAMVKSMLQGVARSSGSSGWLKDLYLDTARAGQPYDAMWNYEALIKETNDALRARGGQLLYAIYPAEGATYADAPLGYVERGQDAKTKAFFMRLQSFLLSAATQQQIAADGRRTAPGMANPAKPEPDWNFDPSRTVPSIALPEPSVIARSLTLYQEVLRRPSLTAICLDFSGSMEGKGEAQLKAAMRTLFNPAEASKSLIQWSAADHVIVIPFDASVRTVIEGDGDAASQARVLLAVESQSAGGGTDMYACAATAFKAMQPYLDKGYLPALLLMTDGKSEHADSFSDIWRQQGHQIPVFGVTFGDADKSQLNAMADMTRARVFDGGKNLTEAFRSARGYN